MFKRDFIDFTSELTGVPKYKLKESMDAFMESIPAALEGGESVQINGLGLFTAREQAARKGRIHGEEIDIPARFRPVFKPGLPLIEAVKRGEPNWRKRLEAEKKQATKGRKKK